MMAECLFVTVIDYATDYKQKSHIRWVPI